MRRRILLSPLAIIIFVILFGVGAASAAIYFGNSGDNNSQGINLQKGLVGWWKLNGNAKDSSANSNHGIVHGTALDTDRKGQSSKAFSFSGSSDYVDGGNNGSLDIPNAITVAAWVKFNNIDYVGSTGKLHFIGAKGYPDAVAPNAGWWFAYDNRGNAQSFNYLAFGNSAGGYAGGGNSFGGSNYYYSFTNGTWYHIAFTVSSSTAKLYINGTQKGPDKALSNLALSDIARNLAIGNMSGGGYDSGSQAVDDFHIYNRALSLAEITALYNEYDPGFVVSDLQKGLVAQWKMNGGLKDNSPYANDGTNNGATLTTDRRGQVNSAYNFNGVGNFVNAGNGTSLNMRTAFTLGAWVKSATNTSPQYQTIINHGSQGSNGEYWLYLTNGKVSLEVGDGTNHSFNENLSPAIGTAGWNHIVVTFNNGALQTYVNGALVSSPSLSVLDTLGGTQTLRIGSYPGTYFFNGTIDDVRIYNRVLSANEVTNLYQEYDPGLVTSNLQKGLVGQWKMDGNAKDYTPYSNSGTNNGATLTTDRKGQSNRAYSFDGNSNYIDSGNGSSLSFGSGALTISVWVNSLTNTDVYAAIIDKGTGDWTGGGAKNGFTLHYYGSGDFTPGNTLAFRLGDGSTSYDQVTFGDLKNVGWTHLVITVDDGTAGNPKITGYKNGAQYAQVARARTGSTNTAVNLNIGQWRAYTRNFNGSIDDVRIYNRALSPTEVTALYESY